VDSDPRLSELGSVILRLAQGEYGARAQPSLLRDEVDAVVVGLNLLAETLAMERDAREAAESLLHDAVHAYEHAPAMFCSVDAASLVIVKCNASFAASQGVPKEEMLSSSLLDHTREDCRSHLQDVLARERQGRAWSTGELHLQAADGRGYPVLMSASHVTEEGYDDRIRLIFRDITQERAWEEQLRHAQKMDAVGRLATGVAHDFNNLLTIVMGVAEQLRGTLHPEHPGAEDAKVIMDTATRAAGLTEQLLTLARKAPSLVRVIDIDAHFGDERAMLEQAVGDRVRVDVSKGRDPLYVRIDATHLTQVVLNLAINARDAMPEGGVLSIDTRMVDSEAVIHIHDTGVGMPAEIVEQAREPFFTTKDGSRGTGVGLAVCQSIVEQAGGSLEILSQVGQGTSIRIRFPLAAPPPSVPGPKKRASTAPERRRILVVDDNDGVRNVLVRTLGAAGHDVVQASNGRTACEVFVADPTFCLVVLDIVMPDMDGGQVAAALWRRVPGLPVVFISGFTDDRIPGSVLGQPHVRFVRKPFAASALQEAVDELVPRSG
jgi:PAS domain S-box-containing protein